MTLTRFKSNPRLWLVLSTILFVVPWFVPITGQEVLWKYWALLFLLPFTPDFTPDHFFFALQGVGIGLLMFGIPALAVGWVLQCLAVMIWRAAIKGGQKPKQQ